MHEEHKRYGWHKVHISLPIASIFIVAASAFAGGAVYHTVSRLESDTQTRYVLEYTTSKAATATCSITASFSPSSVPKGSASTLSWNSTGAASLRRQCTNTCGGSVGVPPAALVWLTPNAPGSAASPLGTTCVGTETCTFYCGDPAGNVASLSKTLTVTAPPCTVSQTFNPSTVTPTQTTQYSWSSTGAGYGTPLNTLRLTCTGAPPYGPWDIALNGAPQTKGPYASTYTCTLTGKNSAGVTCSNTKTLTVVRTPTSFAATAASNSQINLSWVNVTPSASVKIERALASTGPWTQIAVANPGVASYSNTGLPAGTKYYYRIRASLSAVDSPYSAIMNATTKGCTVSQTFNPAVVTPSQTTQYSWSSTGAGYGSPANTVHLTCTGAPPYGPWDIALNGAPQTKGPYPSSYTCTLTGKASDGTTCSNTKMLAVVPSTAGYQGCYTDTATRALPRQLGTTQETIASCRSLAKANGYSYAGLQYYGFCFAGNSLAYTKVTDSECNTPCTGNPGEMCGGSWRNSIWSAIAAPTVKVTSPNTAATWIASTTQAITWTSSNMPAGVTAYIYLLSGTSTYTIASGISNTGSFAWKIPGNCYAYGSSSFCTPNNKIQMKIWNPATSQFIATDISDVNFNIKIEVTFYKYVPGMKILFGATTTVRSAPGSSAGVVGTVSRGTYRTISKIAQYADSQWWWKVAEFPSGWVPEGNTMVVKFSVGDPVVAESNLNLYASPTSSVIVGTMSAGQSGKIGPPSNIKPKLFSMTCNVPGMTEIEKAFCVLTGVGAVPTGGPDGGTWGQVCQMDGTCGWVWNPGLERENPFPTGMLPFMDEDGNMSWVYDPYSDPNSSAYNPTEVGYCYNPVNQTFLTQGRQPCEGGSLACVTNWGRDHLGGSVNLSQRYIPPGFNCQATAGCYTSFFGRQADPGKAFVFEVEFTITIRTNWP